jgi:acetyl esterase/lipase
MKWNMNGVAALLLALATAGGSAFAQSGTAKVPEDVQLVSDVVFGKGGDRELKMHILKPKKAGQEPMPVVVFIFGGAWRTGNKDAGIKPLSVLAQKGYLCASIEYRFSQEALFPAQLEDCKCAIRFLRSKAGEYHINPDKIGVWGMSSGAYLAALLGTTGDVKDFEGKGGSAEFSSRVNAVVDWFGPTDFTKMDAAGSKMKHDPADSPESRLIGGAIQENKDKCAKASPLTYVTSDDPPFLIMHGDRDPVVPISQSELLVAALNKAKVKCVFKPVAGGSHGFVGPQHEKIVLEFLDEQLRGIKPTAKE